MIQVPNGKERGEIHRKKISFFIALVAIGLMLTTTVVSAASASANSSSFIFTNFIGSMFMATPTSKSSSSGSILLSTSIQGWNLTVDGRGVKAYPDLREYVWTTNRPPYGAFDKIALHRLVKLGIETKGVVFILPGTWSNGEQLISNPPEDRWTAYENYSLALYLANRGYDVYSIDYRTHFVPIYLNTSQLSFMADWGWDAWISDIKAAVELAKEVSGAERIYLAGESFGGTAAMNYASIYWAEDLKGIILLDGGTGGKNSSLVTNTFNLPQAINIMIINGTWATEVGSPGAIFLFKYADQYPDAPANIPGTDIPLEPQINPLTGQPWANITEYLAFSIHMSWGPGVVSNIYGGYGKASIMIHIEAGFDRYWPTRLTLESQAIINWDNCPYVTNDFDDNYINIDVPLLAYTSGNFGLRYFGPFIHGIANPDFTGIYLMGYGHLDVYAGEYSERDVNIPTYQWLSSHRMLIGISIIRIDHCWKLGETTIFINGSVIDLKTDYIRASWNIDSHKSLKNLEMYKGSGELGKINTLISNRGPAAATGPAVLFLGKLV
ncbi:MAG: alpha/beta fold hydrolase [Candidatus Jordarchaeaceae archaeon]